MTPIRIVIFAKAPLPGLAKTRLIPALGDKGAAHLAERMLRHTVTEALSAGVKEVELCVTPTPEAPLWQPFRNPLWPVDWQPQGEGDLGARLARAAARGVSEGAAILLIGTDCPSLTAERLQEAARQLLSRDAVIIPSTDGGYVLLGLKRFDASVFEAIPWSTNRVSAETLKKIDTLGWSVGRLPALRDVDTPDDLLALPREWRETSATPM